MIHPAAAFAREVEVVGAVIHLCLKTWGCLEADDRFTRQSRPQFKHSLANDAPTASEPLEPQFLEDALDGDLRIALQQLLDRVVEGIDQAGRRVAGAVAPWPERSASQRRMMACTVSRARCSSRAI